MLRGTARVARDKVPLPEAMATKATAHVREAAMSTNPGPTTLRLLLACKLALTSTLRFETPSKMTWPVTAALELPLWPTAAAAAPALDLGANSGQLLSFEPHNAKHQAGVEPFD